MIVKSPLFPHVLGPPTFVLDQSVTLTWVVPTLANTYTRAVMSAMLQNVAVVPMSWLMALTDAVRNAERRGLSTPPQTAKNFAILTKYPILFDDETDARAWSDILDLARAHNLAVFDAAYLELALRLKLPLATADAALTRAATSAGAPTFTP